MIAREMYEQAEAFEALAANPAWLEIRTWLEGEVLRSEGEAALAAPSVETREIRNRFIAWQERRKVQLGIESLFDEWKREKIRMDEEIANERAIEHERSTRGSW